MDALADLHDLEWHMVGHIQSRKAREIAPRFDIVHSVDSTKLAGRLDRFAGQAQRRLHVLLECNVSGETSKEGWALAQREQWPCALPGFEEILALPNLEVRGLMTMAPFTREESIIRPVFRALRELRDYLDAALPGHWKELSMGMSSDFEIAIEEGATIIRVGQAIFGPRAEYC
jgi:pyridoxal phosphate enzyme (YggS family)